MVNLGFKARRLNSKYFERHRINESGSFGGRYNDKCISVSFFPNRFITDPLRADRTDFQLTKGYRKLTSETTPYIV